MTLGIKIHQLAFNDGTVLSLAENEILIITGANNSGKSQVLRDISGIARNAPRYGSTVLKQLSIDYSADISLLASHSHQFRHESNPNFLYYDENNASTFRELTPPRQLIALGSPFYSLFYLFLENDSRLTASAEAAVPYLRLPRPRRGIVALINNYEAEKDIDRIFHAAFSENLILDRTAGSRVSFCIGNRADLEAHGALHTKSYADFIRLMPRIHDQGDGMRAFATILTETMADPKPLVLIDEPESFLHPPQIRRVAEVLVNEVDPKAQLIIATHSEELVKGLLDAAQERTRVLRLRRQRTTDRDGKTIEINRIAQLDPPQLSALWKDPLLRTSDVISALFHDVAIIVEGEVDARFYRALLDAMIASEGTQWRVPDVRFYYGTGKGSIPKLVRQLRAIEVPVLAVSDIDLLETEGELKSTFSAFGAEFNEIRLDWKILNDFMRGEKPANSVAHVEAVFAKAVSATLDRTAALSRDQREAILEVVRNSTTWTGLRKSGAAWFTSEMTTAGAERHAALTSVEQAFKALLAASAQIGLHILERGSVESFSPRDGSKNAWLENVLKRDLATDPEIDAARKFMKMLVAAAATAIGQGFLVSIDSPQAQ